LKTISIWGSTGSIGQQTLDVIRQFPEQFKIHALTAHTSVSELYKQAEIHRPQCVVITGNADQEEWKKKFQDLDASVLWGKEGLLDLAGSESEDMVVNALVGSVGLEATLKAIQAGTTIGLANKEVLVMAGELITSEAKKKKVSILPIDSEHSAIFQCLQGEPPDQIHKIILTASGGPFLNRDKSEFDSITVDEALNHPNWSMGKKITIDSATMANKGLEVIEARWLFDVRPSQIDVVIHPQSIIHSMVEFVDGSIKAQLGVPDMRTPIAYALTCPDRQAGDYGRMDFKKAFTLDFRPPDFNKFPALRLAYESIKAGGTAPAVFNAADEIAVALFLEKRIRFTHIPKIIEKTLQDHKVVSDLNFEIILQADSEARKKAEKIAGSLQ